MGRRITKQPLRLLQAVDKSARLQKYVARRRCKAAPRLQKSVARPHDPLGRSGFEAALRLHPTLFCGALHLFLWIAPCATFFWSHPLGEKRRDVGTPWRGFFVLLSTIRAEAR